MRAFLRLPKGIVTIHFEMQQPWHAMYLNAVEASVAHEAFPLPLNLLLSATRNSEIEIHDPNTRGYSVSSGFLQRPFRYYNIDEEIKPEQLKNVIVWLTRVMLVAQCAVCTDELVVLGACVTGLTTFLAKVP